MIFFFRNKLTISSLIFTSNSRPSQSIWFFFIAPFADAWREFAWCFMRALAAVSALRRLQGELAAGRLQVLQAQIEPQLHARARSRIDPSLPGGASGPHGISPANSDRRAGLARPACRAADDAADINSN